jgi:hypothetical protein
VRSHAGHVTGVSGPVEIHSAVIDHEPWMISFDDSERALYRFVNHPEQFYLLGPWLQGRYIRPRSPQRRFPDRRPE